eukprot:TRINITY_DN7309_c0_g1_i3.p1 TRINITY_DN7309_c0_g1~~TRINITY_DN7309_c0_g1_i3.p1  ORF type:complete len:578 (-),score=125.25 TRINITY_DN7309_c0_g1_i3:227-1960(-)
MIAIMGPTGCGKSSLLNALSGRFDGELRGELLFNGQPGSSAMKRKMAYVTQDDVLPRVLTVREILMYHAQLRIDKPAPEVECRVDAIISRLGLGKCENTPVMPHGGGRGVSGGERKRAAIACEMILEPAVLFLDEPTSGLDSFTAGHLMSTLQQLARSGQAIGCSIHQPSSMLMSTFDRLLLLAQGHTVYFGPSQSAVVYFKKLGFTCPQFWNPADFYLELLSDPRDGSGSVASETQSQLVEAWREHSLEDVLPAEHGDGVEDGDGEGGYEVSYLRAVTVLLARSFRIKSRSIMTAENLIQHIGLPVMAGMLWFDQGYEEEDINNRRSLLWFVSVYWGFQPMFVAAMQFPSDKPLIEKERQSGMYPLSAWFVAHTVSILSMFMLWPLLFVTILYWMGNMSSALSSFLGVLGLVVLGVMAAFNIGSCFGMWFNDLVLGLTFMSTYMLSSMLSGGFVIDQIPSFISWYQYAAFSHFTLAGLTALEFTDDTQFSCDPNSSSFDPCQSSTSVSGKQIREEYQVKTDIWVCVVALLGFTIAFGLLAFLGLKTRVRRTQLAAIQPNVEEAKPGKMGQIKVVTV